MVAQARVEEYKRAFARITAIFFIMWFIIALGVHLPAKVLYEAGRIGGAPLNWWMIQISIFLGVILAFAYAFVMNKVEESYGFRG